MKAARLVGNSGSLAGTSIELTKSRVLVGRDADSCDLVLSQPFISKRHAVFESDDSGVTTVRDLGSKYGTYVNGKSVGERLLADGDRVGFGPSGLILFTYSVNGGPEDVTLQRAAVQAPEVSTASPETCRAEQARSRTELDGAETVRVATASVLNIGRAHDNDIVLNGAAVSRHHARLMLGNGTPPVLLDVGSTNGTYVNGELLREARSLERDDVIFLGGFIFNVDGRTVRQIDLSASRICALGLSKAIKGEPVMHDISLAVLPGEFVGLMGPSGCGKSTLMDAMDGLQPAPVGSVFLGDLDLYRNFNSVRRSIGHVPQHDILHDDLTVGRTLLYAARLRLPETTSEPDIQSVVTNVVDIVNLRHKLATPFRNLSGGEQKRL
ncbi:MAG TPA: FHA domain-containing protein, partial [Dongiaceae bacterium]|nr:FHA domain-containing protein [Dongiaceae bacterium]